MVERLSNLKMVMSSYQMGVVYGSFHRQIDKIVVFNKSFSKKLKNYLSKEDLPLALEKGRIFLRNIEDWPEIKKYGKR